MLMPSSDIIELCLSPVLSLDAYWVRFISLLDIPPRQPPHRLRPRPSADEEGQRSRTRIKIQDDPDVGAVFVWLSRIQ
ncbi:hypothetical protein CF326_g8931 [Tilletia indica]|nr:hypothetical protein CF326_g8931 [Tilletia indica]